MTQIPTAPPADDADLRQATILFADISGYTAITETYGAEFSRDMMNLCFARIEKISMARGGIVHKYTGDCAMVLFGAPRALEGGPAFACDAAMAIRDAVYEVRRLNEKYDKLDVHTGINSGLVASGLVGGALTGAFDVMGPAVNLAARIYNAAKNGQIFVGPETARAADDTFEFSEPFELEFKNIAKPVPVRELLGYRSDASRVIGKRRIKTTALVGRDEDLKKLVTKLAGVGGDRGAVVGVCGEGGIGKTRLVSEAVEELSDESRAIELGTCTPVGRNLSFHPFSDLFRKWIGRVLDRSVFDDLASISEFAAKVAHVEDREVVASIAIVLGLSLPPEEQSLWATMSPDAQERFVHAAIGRFLAAAAREQPLVVVLEDMYWADDSTLALVESLLPLALSAPLGFLLVYRPGYDETSGRCVRFAQMHVPAVWHEVRLEALGPDDTSTLLRRLLMVDLVPRALLEIVTERANGNPFFIEEIVDDLKERGAIPVGEPGVLSTLLLREVSIPLTVEEVILSRVERLSAQVRGVLNVAAVVGRNCREDIVRTVVGPDPDAATALDELELYGFLIPIDPIAIVDDRRREGKREFQFRHALLQQAVYSALLKRRRREMHLLCAKAIEALFESTLEEQLGVLAYHYLEAEELVRAEDLLFRAGERAAASAASREALRYFRTAYETYTKLHGERGDAARKALLEKQIGLALLNTGELVASIDHLNASLRLRGERVPERPFQMNLKVIGDLGALLFDLRFGSLEKRRARSNSEDRDLFETLYNRCRAQNATDPRRAFFDNIAAIRHVRHLDPSTVPHACGIYAASGAFFGFSGLSFGIADRFLAIAEQAAATGSDEDKFQFAAMRFVTAYLCGDWSPALVVDPKLVERGIRAGLLWDADTYLGLLAEKQIKQGFFADAESTIAMLEHLVGAYGYGFSEANVLANRAYLLAERRAYPEAWAAINKYGDSRDEDTLRVIALSTRAKIELAIGERADARKTLASVEATLRRAARMVPYYASAYATAAAALAVAELERAQTTERPQGVLRARFVARRAIERAARFARKVARERVQVHGLAARCFAACNQRNKAEAAWVAGLAEADRLLTSPDRRLLCADIAAYLEREGGMIDGHEVGNWKRGAEAVRELGRS